MAYLEGPPKLFSRSPTFALLLLMALVGFLVRVHGLDWESMWLDEVDAVAFASRGLPDLLAPFLQRGENGALYFLALHFWVGLVGTTAFAVRFFSLLFGILTIPLIYQLGRLLLGREVGLFAAVLAATSPYYLWYSQDAKMYTAVTFATMLSVYLFLRALATNRRSFWAAYILATTLSLYIHLAAALIIAFEDLLFAAFWRRHRYAVRGWLVSQAFLVLPYIPLGLWEIPRLLKDEPTGYPFVPLAEMLRVLLSRFSLNADPSAVGWGVGLFALLALAGVLLGRDEAVPTGRQASHVRRGWPPWGVVVLLLYFLVPVVAFFLITLRMPFFRDRYLIFVSPAYYLAVAAGLAAMRRFSPALVGLALALLAFLWLPAAWSPPPTKPDFRAAAAIVQAKAEAGDVLVFVANYARRPFAYYYPGPFRWLDLPYTNYNIGEKTVADAIGRAVKGQRRLWLVMWEEWMWDSRGLIQRWLEANGTLIYQESVLGVKLFCYQLSQER